MRTLGAWLGIVAISATIGYLPSLSGIHAFWPAISALIGILISRQAAHGLGMGVAAGVLIIAGGMPIDALRMLFSDHLFPALESKWHIGAIVFTLLLGAFAGLLENSGGFETLLDRFTRGSNKPRRRVLGGIYGLGLVCFFDGLANSMICGRISRSAVDRIGVSREKLAWIVDSTSAPIACVAFISTWIATQLSLIKNSLPDLNAYSLYFKSIPANPYCLLTLALVPLAIFREWDPAPMNRYQALGSVDDTTSSRGTKVWRVLLPLVILAISIACSFQIWSGNTVNFFSMDAWREAASGEAGYIALVAGAIGGLIAAWWCYPTSETRERAKVAIRGASGLMPAVVILILAWMLGSVFKEVGAADAIKQMLGENISVKWLPLIVFLTTSATAFATGSSWGTMGLMMPLALGVLVEAADFDATLKFAPAIIGAVFGGAVFGDHSSPFSDTTIVSAMAAGCAPMNHVLSQLPYAMTVAVASILSYTLIAIQWMPIIATTVAGVAMGALVIILSRKTKSPS